MVSYLIYVRRGIRIHPLYRFLVLPHPLSAPAAAPIWFRADARPAAARVGWCRGAATQRVALLPSSPSSATVGGTGGVRWDRPPTTIKAVLGAPPAAPPFAMAAPESVPSASAREWSTEQVEWVACGGMRWFCWCGYRFGWALSGRSRWRDSAAALCGNYLTNWRHHRSLHINSQHKTTTSH